MDSSVSAKDEIRFLRVCHHVSNALYNPTREFLITLAGISHFSAPGSEENTVDLTLGLPQVLFSQGMSSVSTQKLFSWRVSLNLYKCPVLYYFYFLKILRILTVLKCKKYIPTFLINTYIAINTIRVNKNSSWPSESLGKCRHGNSE